MPSRGGDGNGNGYIAQARELELARREALRLAHELSGKDAALDQMRGQLNQEQAVSRELGAAMAHHVRTAFALGLGAGVLACVVVWGLLLLLR